MSLKLSLVILAGLLEIFCIFIFTEAGLRKRPRGRKLLELVEGGAAKFTNWRADADVRDEMKWVKRVCGMAFAASLILLFLSAVFRLQLLGLLILPFFVVSFFGYFSLEWILNWRAIFKFYGVFFLLLLAAIMYAYHGQAPEYQRLAALCVGSARLFGVTHPEPSLAFTLIVSAIVFLSMFALMTVIAVAVSAGVFTPLWLTSRLSDLLRKKFDREVLWWTAFTTQIVLVILQGVVNMM